MGRGKEIDDSPYGLNSSVGYWFVPPVVHMLKAIPPAGALWEVMRS